jgi:serine/threonine-protein kinase
MGKVYEAIDQALERRVAVKVIRDEWVYSAAAVERFRREARAVAGFDHPNVVTVHDYGVEAGRRAFLVMELLDGVTLRDELRRCERLGAAPTIQLFRGLCSAVEAAHRRQLVHRDLKPENIFLVRAHDGHAVTVKVLDFGVVKPLTASADQVPEGPDTDLGVMVGTVGYMSPEQLMGEPPGVSWDLWALAVVAYESLAGALPFPVASRESWRQLVLSGRHAPLCEHLVDPPCAWEDFFARALATDRTRRPRSAADFFQQLEQALA